VCVRERERERERGGRERERERERACVSVCVSLSVSVFVYVRLLFLGASVRHHHHHHHRQQQRQNMSILAAPMCRRGCIFATFPHSFVCMFNLVYVHIPIHLFVHLCFCSVTRALETFKFLSEDPFLYDFL